MKLTKASGALGIATLAAIAGPFTVPFAMANDTGWYTGINIGQSKATIDDARIASGLLAGGFTTASLADDNRDSAYKFYGGYRLSRHFALEGGYFDLGKFGFTATTVPAGTLRGDIKLRGVNLDAVGILPITERFSALGRIGINHAKATDTFAGTGLVYVSNPNPSKRDTNYKVGLGLQYDFSARLGMRVEVERYRVDDAVGNKGDVDLASVGLVYRFGANSPRRYSRIDAPEPAAIVARTVAPEPVATAPAPRPLPAVPPPPLMKVTFSADALFDFDKATVKPAGKQALDKFVSDLRGINFDLIAVIGHADRIGSQAYNAQLATRRAEAVKAYLVEPAGIAAGKISARGADESDPVTKPGECNGVKATAKLIACLQPDRRVEVEVTGTK